MKKLLISTAILLPVLAFAKPEVAEIQANLQKSLTNLQSVQVLSIERDLSYLMTCTLSPYVCFDGIKEYKLNLKVTMLNKYDVDYVCELTTQKMNDKIQMAVRLCLPQGHAVKFKEFTQGKNSVTFSN